MQYHRRRAAADVLAARTDNDELFSVIKTLSGDVIVRPTKQILEAITGKRWEEDKLEEEVAIELIRQIDEQDDTLKNVMILTAALPASSAQSMITEQYGTNTTGAGRSVFMTTLFSVITVPLIMMIAFA